MTSQTDPTPRAARSALVTGAARRIGRAICERLADEGWNLALHSSTRSIAETRTLAKDLQARGVAAGVVMADLADPASPAALIEAARHNADNLCLLVNNASIFEPDSAVDLDAESWERHFAINLRAPVALSSLFAKSLNGSAGAIVNIVDQRVLRLTPRYFSYTLAKSALWTATQTMAQAFAPHIRVNAVGPGPVLPNQNEGGEGFAREAASVPLEHAVTPREIADAVAWLANAPSVTGQMICVDAGQHLSWKTPDAII